MERRFVVPVVTMFAGVFIWLVLLVWHALADSSNQWSAWTEAVAYLAAGGLVVFSGFR